MLAVHDLCVVRCRSLRYATLFSATRSGDDSGVTSRIRGLRGGFSFEPCRSFGYSKSVGAQHALARSLHGSCSAGFQPSRAAVALAVPMRPNSSIRDKPERESSCIRSITAQ